MQFGFTLKPDHTIERTLALARQAEAAGFDYGWLFDSHVLWREPYPLLTLMAQATTRLRLGTCVTNPATREPSVTASSLAVLDELRGGRMDLGIGRGDSARRVLGKPPTTMATLEEAISSSGSSSRAGPIDVRGDRARLAVDRALDAAGLGRRLRADGPGDDRPGRRRRDPPARGPGPDPLVRRPDPGRRGRRGATRGQREGPGRGAGARRRPRDDGRERTRWFPALVSNHVVDLVNKYPREQLPESLTGYIRDRDAATTTTITPRSARRTPAFVGDEVTDRFCVLGSADEHIAKLHELAEAGVDQFNIYLMNGDEEAQLEAYASIVPRLPGGRRVPLRSPRTDRLDGASGHRDVTPSAHSGVGPVGSCMVPDPTVSLARAGWLDETWAGPMVARSAIHPPGPSSSREVPPCRCCPAVAIPTGTSMAPPPVAVVAGRVWCP